MKKIFPKNWPTAKKRLKHWQSEEVQKNICPECHCYTGRFSFDNACQFCGFKIPKTNFELLGEAVEDLKKAVKEAFLNDIRLIIKFIKSIIS